MAAMKALRDWWHSLAVAPSPLTTRERLVIVVIALAVAPTRWLALSSTPWDWDEALFMLAMRRYDVAAHHPHPPGFPLFIVAGKIMHRLGLSDFRSLQAVAMIGAMLIVPATFYLCRELRMRFIPSLAAGGILAFFPNVWFYGGTAFSDVPAMTLVILALALLLAGCRDARFYFAGAVVLAVAAGIRPQNLLIAFVPAVIASVFQGWRKALAATVIGALIVGASYGVAAENTGWENYRLALAMHSEYITKVDSFRSPGRPPLYRLFDDFFMRPYRAPLINILVTIFAAASFVLSFVKLRAHTLAVIAAFGPFCFLAWLMLDHFSVSRFSIGYAPVIAILTADGISIFVDGIRGTVRSAPIADALEVSLATALVALMIVWTWPALRVVRSTISPPVMAIEWIRGHVPRTATVYVHPGMSPYAEEFIDDYRLVYVIQPPAREWSSEVSPLYLREDIANVSDAHNFTRNREPLWQLVRQRYFEVSIRPVTAVVTFGGGWYDEETHDGMTWRWMGRRAVMTLPSIRGRARLSLALYAPVDVLGAQPNVTLTLNGAIIARLHSSTSDFSFDGVVGTRPGAANELAIETDRVVRPRDIRGADNRVIGLRLNQIGWGASE
jgi:hypothetical protein